MLEALLLTLFPAVGSLVGGLLAMKIGLTRQYLAFALHLGAGVVLGVVGVELMPRVLQTDLPIVILIAFVSGSAVFVGFDWLADRVGRRFGSAEMGGVFSIVFGVGFDLLTDGMMIAVGQRIGGGLGLMLGLGLLMADTPEAFATIATVSRQLSRRVTLLITLIFPALTLLGVPIGYLALRGQPQVVEFAMLSFTAGLLVLVVVEGLIPEAHQLTRRSAGIAGLLFSIGFTIFAALSLYFG